MKKVVSITAFTLFLFIAVFMFIYMLYNVFNYTGQSGLIVFCALQFIVSCIVASTIANNYG